MSDTEKQIAAKIRKAQGPTAAELGLRFDRVAVRLTGSLRAFAKGSVPEGTTVLITLTAPIRLPAKTASALEIKIRRLLDRGAPRRDQNIEVHGNQVRIRLVNHGSERAPKFLGFVHNPGSNPKEILDLAAQTAIS